MSSTRHIHMPHVVDVHVPWRAPHHPSKEKPILEHVDLASPIHTGYMYKEAHTHLVFHKRFFVLFPRALVYYEKESEYKKDLEKGSLEHRHRAIGLEGLYLSKPEKKIKGAKFCFILHTPDERNARHDFLLVTDTKDDRKHWIEVLQDQNPNLLDPKHHTGRIQPDTPQGSRRGSAVQYEITTIKEQSPLITASVKSTDSPHMILNTQVSYPERPGSPRQDVHRRTSNVSTTSDFLDIQYLNIRDGPSDNEDGPSS